MNIPVLKKNIVIVIYVIVLSAIAFISVPEAEYSIIIRLLLFGASVLPVLFSTRYIIFSFTCFYSINSTSFCRLLPSDAYYYYILIILVLLINKCSNESKIRVMNCYLSILPFYFISLLYGDVQNFQLWWAVCLLFIPLLESEINLKLLALSFPVISLTLSILFLLNQEYFLFNYTDDLDRSGWINPNEFGGILGIGVVVGIALLLKQIKLNISFKESILLIVSIVITFIVIVMNASRGAFIASSLGSLLLVLVSNVKIRYKIIIITLLTTFIAILWQYDYFELLLYRMNADTADTAGNRSLIWAEKLNCFLIEGNPMQWLIGVGGRAGAEIIGHTYGIQNMSTHNDFVTAIIGFGIPCFFWLLYILTFPIFNTPKGHNRLVIGLFIVFIAFESFVLEPLFRGYVPYIMFYIFLFSYSYFLKKQPTRK